MINTILGITGTLFIAALTLEIIGIAKNIKLMKFIAKPFLFPLTTISSIFILVEFLPDSKNIIIFSSIALAFFIGGSIALLFENKYSVLTGCMLYASGNLSYFYIFHPSFFLYPLKIWAVVCIVIFYISISVMCYIFFLKKKDRLLIISFVTYFVIQSFIHYGALLTLIGQPELYSTFLFLGTTITFTGSMFKAYDLFNDGKKRSSQITAISCYIIGVLLITAGFILMTAS